jgi:glycosyltransferase involved in cell wall biosynthesis
MVVLDYMSREDLLSCIRNAVCMVISSRLEGFGLTAVESMALATPVVASDNSALPETLNGAGILVDPTSATAVADAVERIFHCSDVRVAMAAAGLKRARDFTWTKCMERLLSAVGTNMNNKERAF